MNIVISEIEVSPDSKIFSFFGHKPQDLGGFDELSLINKWVKFSLKTITSHLVSIYDDVIFLCGTQPGTEMWSLEEVLRLRDKEKEGKKVSVVAALPFPNVSGRDLDGSPLTKKPWPLQSHKRLLEALGRADDIKVLSEGPYSSWRIRARDEWVIQRSSGLVTVYKETQGPAEKKEDIQLQHVMKYAEEQRVQICIIDPTNERMFTR